MADHYRPEESLRILDKFWTSISESAKNIKSNDATFKISTLPKLSNRLTKIFDAYSSSYLDVLASQKAFEQLNAEFEAIDEGDQDAQDYIETEEYSQRFHKISSAEKKKVDKSVVNRNKKTLDSIIKPDDEDIVIEAPTRQIPKDPITKTNIQNAVRSTVCNHIFDKTSIEDYILSREKAKKKNIQCPQAGCTNRSMKRSELVPDDEVNNLIQN